MHFYVYSKRLEDTIVIQFVFSSLFLLPESSAHPLSCTLSKDCLKSFELYCNTML